MSTVTPHLSLVKPDPPELVNVVTHINNNLDKLDANAQSNSSRLNSVEAVAGISNDWQTDWVPVVKTAAGTVLSHTVSVAEYVLLGTIVFFEVDITITQATASHSGGPCLEMPYEIMHSALVADATVSGGGFNKKLHCIVDPGDSSFMQTRYMQDDAGGDPLIVEPSGSFAISMPVNSVFKANGWYRTSGTPVP